jgi:hypothetical protein
MASSSLLPPPSFDAKFPSHFFQRHAFGFSHHGLHPGELEDHHTAEKQEHIAGRKGRYHSWKEGGQQRGENPVSEAAQRLAFGTVAVYLFLFDMRLICLRSVVAAGGSQQ